MTDKAMVTEVSDSTVTVIPLIKDACLHCTSGCAKQGKPFTVKNPSSFILAKGNIVQIQAPKKIQFLQGIIALVFPLLCAVLGFAAASPVASFFHTTATEGFKALCVLAFLFISLTAVFFISRKFKNYGQPEIISVD